ncbi:MAG: energy-coupling factor transporter transmembrane protein EcfT [Desulfohalobiaceae bacterium]|nr:energy-coupling factor transporter transmembrane protein EcfT [Desulfohalobiaceae bacterium]
MKEDTLAGIRTDGGRSPGAAGAALHRTDPLVKLGVGLCLGIFTWQAGPVGLACYLAGLVLVGLLAPGRGELRPVSLRAVIILLLLWVLLKAGFELWEGAAPFAALHQAGLLGLRLMILILGGLCLTAVTSTRQIGLAVDRLLRPVAGERSWRGALGLALMIHFLPLTLRILRQAGMSLRMRKVRRGAATRLRLWIQTVLRVLARTTWQQTLAIAARGLDEPEAWRGRVPVSWRQIGAGALLAMGIAAAAWI